MTVNLKGTKTYQSVKGRWNHSAPEDPKQDISMLFTELVKNVDAKLQRYYIDQLRMWSHQSSPPSSLRRQQGCSTQDVAIKNVPSLQLEYYMGNGVECQHTT